MSYFSFNLMQHLLRWIIFNIISIIFCRIAVSTCFDWTRSEWWTRRCVAVLPAISITPATLTALLRSLKLSAIFVSSFLPSAESRGVKRYERIFITDIDNNIWIKNMSLYTLPPSSLFLSLASFLPLSFPPTLFHSL